MRGAATPKSRTSASAVCTMAVAIASAESTRGTWASAWWIVAERYAQARAGEHHGHRAGAEARLQELGVPGKGEAGGAARGLVDRRRHQRVELAGQRVGDGGLEVGDLRAAGGLGRRAPGTRPSSEVTGTSSAPTPAHKMASP